MSSTNPGSSNSSNGGSAFGRMFRRYSQTNTKTDNQRSSRERESARDPDGFATMTRNTSSPSLAREPPSGPIRSPSANGSQHFPRSSSASSHLLDRSSAELAAVPPSVLPDVPESLPPSQAPPLPVAEVAEESTMAPASTARPRSDVHRIRLVPHLEATRSLHFEPIERDMKEGASPVKVGRFTDRQPSQQDPNSTLSGAGFTADGTFTGAPDLLSPSSRGQPGARGGAIPLSGSNGGGGRIDSSRIAFKSKVVSRGHSELWCEPGGKFFIRDTKSSSGTFLNHIRLSAPNNESRPFAIKDGDVIQLGVDYQGGTEEIYRCVKMRVELNRGWQREANQFNVNALRQLRALQGSPLTADDNGKSATVLPTNRQGVSVTDCCICLFSVTVCQALFIAPCSHVFHYKCIRPLLNLHHPGFSCPLCRTFADLDADVEEDEAWQAALLQEAATAEALVAQGQAPLEVGTPAVELDTPLIAAFSPPSSDAADSANLGVDTSGNRISSAVLRSTVATSPVLADLHASGPTFAAVGRGTAASSARKNDWAAGTGRMGNAFGTVPDQIPENAAVASSGGGEWDGADTRLARLDTQVAELALADDTPGVVRRGSGPIPIGGTRSAQRNAAAATVDSQPTSSSYAGENDWPSGPPLDSFSPSADENGTPLNSTFLSTLAEPPRMLGPSHARANRHSSTAARLMHSSDGGDDVDTVEDEQSTGSPPEASTTNGKGKAKLPVAPSTSHTATLASSHPKFPSAQQQHLSPTHTSASPLDP